MWLFEVSVFVFILHNVAGDFLSCERGYMRTGSSRMLRMTLTNVTDQWLQQCSHNFEEVNNIRLIVMSVKNSYIQLTTLHEVLVRYQINRNVSQLKVTDCDLTEVPADIFTSYRNLLWLDLRRNNISVLAANAFYNLTSLQRINLSNNRITEIPAKVFNTLPALRELYLTNNNIRVISDDATVSVPLLGTIYLIKNQLTQIPYKTFKMIKHLYITDNDITAISDDIVTMERLEVLDIANNRLENISGNIALLPDLSDLYIYNNQLTTLPWEMRNIFNRSVPPIQLMFNLWICDCSLMWLIKMVQSGYSNETIVCDQPRNTTFTQYDVKQLTCDVIVMDKVLSLEVICVVVFVPTGVLFVAVSVFFVSRKKLSKKKCPVKMVINGNYYKPRTVADVSTVSVSASSNYDECTASDWNDTHTQALGFSDTNTNGKLRLNKLIGRGAFGDVYEGCASGVDNVWRKVAVKKIRDKTSETDNALLKREFQYLTEIGKHPNIIQVYGSGTINGSVIIVMELAEHGDLLAFLVKEERSNSKVVNNLDKSEEKSYLQTYNKQLFVFMWNVAKGMEYLSRMKIVHRDLAARNILLAKGPVAKISDFGLSRDIYESGYYYQESKGRLPYKWMSPETLSSGKYTIKSDVWSYGILLWEVVTLGSSPYPGIPPDMLLDMYKAGYTMPQPPLCPDTLYTIMKHCWNHVADERPDFDVLVEAIDKFIQMCAGQEYVEVNVDESTSMLDGEVKQ